MLSQNNHPHMINYSFIIPHHNAPELLNRCLASIPEREDIQIIVVDDNSRDDLKPCIERNDVEVIYIDAQHTKGAGRARNVGMSHAKGKWLLFADCDDYYAEDFIEVLDEYKDKDIDALYFNYAVIDSSTSCIVPDNFVQTAINTYEKEDQFLIMKYKNNAPWDKMVRRSFVMEHNMYFEEVKNSNDALFAFFIASYARQIVVEKKKLYVYILNASGLTFKRQSMKDVLCRIDHYIKYNAFTKHIGHPELVFPLMRYVLGMIRHNPRLLPIAPITLWKYSFDKRLRNSWIKIIKSNPL